MYQKSRDGERTLEGRLWENIRGRCDPDGALQRANPSYIGCTMSPAFSDFQRFAVWANAQVGFGARDAAGKLWNLDKDFIVRGNKVYAEDTCAFLPTRLNTLFVSRKKVRGSYPVGVTWCKRKLKFRAVCSDGVTYRHLGYFETPEAAFQMYKTFKEALAKQLAEKYKGQVDQRVYDALVAYEVDIND